MARVNNCKLECGLGCLERLYSSLTLNSHDVIAWQVKAVLVCLESPSSSITRSIHVKSGNTWKITLDTSAASAYTKTRVRDLTTRWHRIKSFELKRRRSFWVIIRQGIWLSFWQNSIGVNARINNVNCFWLVWFASRNQRVLSKMCIHSDLMQAYKTILFWEDIELSLLGVVSHRQGSLCDWLTHKCSKIG